MIKNVGEIIEFDQSGYTKFDIFKVARIIYTKPMLCYSIGLDPPEDEGEEAEKWAYGRYYMPGIHTLARPNTIGLFCFLMQDLAELLIDKIYKRQYVKRYPDGLIILKGRGIGPVIPRPTRIANTQSNRKLDHFYRNHRFDFNANRWVAIDNADTRYTSREMLLSQTIFFQGFLTLGAIPYSPPNSDVVAEAPVRYDSPEIIKYREEMGEEDYQPRSIEKLRPGEDAPDVKMLRRLRRRKRKKAIDFK
jgi:hypothetical protein